MIIAWIKRYALDIRNVVLHGALSCIGASFVAAGLLVVSPPLAAVLASACALVGAWAPVALGRGGAPSAFERAATASGFRMASRALLSVIWLPLTGFLVCLLMSSSCEFSVSGATLRSELIGGVLASCIALSLCLARRKTPFVLLIDKLVVPGLVAISVVLGGFPAGSLPFVAGAAYIFVPMMFLSLFAISSLAVASATGEFSLPFVFGAAFCLGNLATLVGLAMGGGLAGSDASGPFLWVIICGYFAVVIIQLGYSSWRQLCRPDEADGLARAANPEAVEAYRRRCVERLSDACGLTNREREILGYLSRGYGSSFIAKSLFISDNTARTHIRNIYRKLGVSSREEVLSLFNGDAMGDGV
ncbi:LuxR C-terminal-related transcriptional regulator [Rubneribacter badeniensis]|uniref:helix-turn-helix transcriptional regulator n=1 Tax=Rubneribacter badeniensis TaxID=2070688 RepID=UPI003A943410